MNDDFEDESSHWELHPLTRRTAKYLERRAELALNELKGRCAISTDPLVALAWGRYSALHEQLTYYQSRAVRSSALREYA